MYQTARDSHSNRGQTGETIQTPPGEPARLQVIHELVSSGDYHVPAAEIADRIIERIMVDKRGLKS
jgi:hypothetical protein